MSDTTSPAVPRAAATILLVRDEPGFEVLMVERSDQIDVLGGALVFPGGKSGADDGHEAWADHALGWGSHEPAQRQLRVAAIREAFEEAGILLARRRNGAPLGAEACDLEVRRAVDRGERSFLDVVRGLDAQIDLDALTVFAHWVTPPESAKRFDTWFYLARSPADQLAVCDERETVHAEWFTPQEALRLGESGARKLVFVTKLNLRRLAEARDSAQAVAQAKARPPVTVQAQMRRDPDGARYITLAPEAGYGLVKERLPA